MKKDMHKKPLDLTAVRARLAGLHGKQYWRTLEELAEGEEFQELLHREFPRQAEWLGPVSRRQFLKVMGASLALAGLTACGRTPPANILPYVEAPENIVPGKPLFFATAMPDVRFATGLLVENHMGRPTKIEGNPQHPASLGATDSFAQGSILTMYDPDRSQAVTNLGRISTWNAFLATLTTELERQRTQDGRGLRLLTETVTSPTLASQIQSLLDEFPSARWHQYEPVSLDNVLEGARLAFGEAVNTVYRFDQAERILSLDANFMLSYPGNVRYSYDWSNRRRVREGQAEMNRMYVVESMPTVTGSMADHRLPLRSSQIEAFTRAVAQQLGVEGVEGDTTPPAEVPAEWLSALVSDLQQHRSSSIVLAGEEQPPIVHALAHAMNDALGNVGNTVIHTQSVEANPVNQTEELRELVTDMNNGEVDALIIISGNPVYTAPADLNFANSLNNVRFRVHLGLYQDETAAWSHWHIPETHFLETWSDARAFDGTVSIIQPLIEPLYNGISAHELLAAMLNQPNQSSHDIVRSYWQGQNLPGDFEQTWRRALHDGLIDGTGFNARRVSLRTGFAGQAAEQVGDTESLEIVFRPDPTIWDGRFANNAWMQELPKTLTMLTWDNAAFISLNTAERLGVTNEDLVELQYRENTVRAPIWIVPGHADDSVTVTLGYGRTRVGRVGEGLGYNAYALRTSDAPWISSGLQVVPTGQRYPLADTQGHYSLEGRNLVRAGTIEEFKEHPDFVHEAGHGGPIVEEDPQVGGHEEEQAGHEGAQEGPAGTDPEGPAGTEGVVPEPPSLYPEYPYEGYAWGMAIDLNVCIGCQACNIACMAENNIPVVGKENVLLKREMYWIKVDQYYEGNPENPAIYHQPRPCMHCEKAPCEPVCPVTATSHSAEGLNEMTYNRCVGTRYCSNNCPYKVRRFNFLDFTEDDIPVVKMWKNPDVTVRARGVMEKCTYCVQRINHARIEAKKEGRQIRDREIFTACQQACPTRAIVFGNINDPNSEVRKLKDQPHNYGMLAEELGTQPRTTYLARLRNPNPEIETE
jgi:MoCo/4Fe-4S cofactor protein with predicted Tat translocation signal